MAGNTTLPKEDLDRDPDDDHEQTQAQKEGD